MLRTLTILGLLALLAAGCGDTDKGTATGGGDAVPNADDAGTTPLVDDGAAETIRTGIADGVEASAPLPEGRSAWEVAAKKRLPKTKPAEYPGLQNVFRLSDRIISGSEPHGEEAMKTLAEMGVKTILSVDGKAPDAETAKKLGLRYVHVPIQYSGITEAERLRIAKVFRELPGPFYVHCFHGVHRGPAAAAWGRVVLDGVSRQEALAEMRQWCGVSVKYRGLYRDVGKAAAPTNAELAALEWDFPAKHEFKGFRHVMVEVSRVFENLKGLKKIKWTVDPEHPDLSALNEAKKLLQAFQSVPHQPGYAERPDDFRRWSDRSVEYSEKLVKRLERLGAGDRKAREGADNAFAEVKQRCDSCHGTYRNRLK